MKKIFNIIIPIICIFIGIIGTICFYNIKSKNINIFTYNDTSSLKESIKKVYDSVVLVENYKSDKLVATGTGFIYKKDDTNSYILTNNHVISSSDNIKIMLPNSEVLDTTLVGKDVFSDIAVLKVNNTNLKVSDIGKSSELELGDTVFTVGSPLGIDFQGTITKGIISGLNRLIEVHLSIGESLMDVIQTDAAINEGNSGGPLCNIKGEVIGINSLKISGDGAEGMGFAIPIENALEVANKLEIEGHIDRPSIGVSLTDIDNTILTEIGINVPDINYGAVITNVKSNSDAATAGLKKGDVITKINNTVVKTAPHFRYLLYKNKLNDEITIEYIRNSNNEETKVVLTDILSIKD